MTPAEQGGATGGSAADRQGRGRRERCDERSLARVLGRVDTLLGIGLRHACLLHDELHQVRRAPNVQLAGRSPLALLERVID